MSDQLQKKLIIGGLAILTLMLVFFAGEKTGANVSQARVALPEDSPITATQFDAFWKVWKVLDDKYVAATTTDSQERVWGAIKGLAASQNDPYTVFFPPEENTVFKSDIAGNFEGVGMELGLKDGILTVIAPLKNSPAERAGVRSGDRVIEIEGRSTSDMTVEAAVKLIRGKKGTSVKVTFAREGVSEPLVKTLIREVINIPTIETEIKNTATKNDATSTPSTGLRSDGIYVIRLFSFTAQSHILFRQALREFLQSGSHKLIIDLRSNPGGYLDSAWDIASWFLPSGEIVVTEDFGGRRSNKVYESKGYNVLNKFFGKGNYSVIVLVNNGSASASEILAGALREHDVAILVGTETFGKGSVQELVEITPETSLKVTIARWLTPKGHNLSDGGLAPDVEVKVTQKDLEAKRDPQMEKAVEILRQKK